MIGIELYPEEVARRKGFWKFDSQLLDDENFVQGLELKVTETIDQNRELNPNDRRENVKLAIQSFSRLVDTRQERRKVKEKDFLSFRRN